MKVELNQSSTGGVAGQPNQNPFPNPAVPGQMQYVPFYAYSTHQPYVLNYEAPSLINDNQIDRYGLELRYTLPNGVVLRSQSGYQDHYFRTSAENSNDAFNDSIQYTQVGPGDRNYYQEINAISPDTGRLTWVAGTAAFYRDTPVYASSNRLSLPAAGPLSSGPSPETALAIVSVTRSLGVFGQLSYKLLDTLQLQAGIRENWDNNFNGGAISVIGPFGPLAVIPNTGQFKSSTPTAKVGLNWSPVADQFVYAFGARGYKSGGVNVATGLPFEDEHVNDYEAGINSRFLDGHLQTRLGAYYMVYEGMQEDIFNAKAGYINVTDAVAKVNQRAVPILENLKRRLAAYPEAEKRDKISKRWRSSNSLYHVWKRVTDKAGLPYKKNAFRNSYISYRLAQTKDINLVAYESGNSPEMIRKYYLDLVTPEQAAA